MIALTHPLLDAYELSSLDLMGASPARIGYAAYQAKFSVAREALIAALEAADKADAQTKRMTEALNLALPILKEERRVQIDSYAEGGSKERADVRDPDALEWLLPVEAAIAAIEAVFASGTAAPDQDQVRSADTATIHEPDSPVANAFHSAASALDGLRIEDCQDVTVSLLASVIVQHYRQAALPLRLALECADAAIADVKENIRANWERSHAG